jgi:hypothetical protein
MTALLNAPITTAVTAQVGSTFQLRETGGNAPPTIITLQGTLTYTSGGTTADAWVQTTLDGGLTWNDLANFHFTTAAGRLVFNLNVVPVNTIIAQITSFTDGTLAANTAIAVPFFGSMFRVKYTTTGTYVGTTLRVDAICAGLTLAGPGS